MYTLPERTEEERMNTFQLVFWDQCYPPTKTGVDIWLHECMFKNSKQIFSKLNPTILKKKMNQDHVNLTF